MGALVLIIQDAPVTPGRKRKLRMLDAAEIGFEMRQVEDGGVVNEWLV